MISNEDMWKLTGLDAPRRQSYEAGDLVSGGYTFFLYGLVRLRRARLVVEIGTYQGLGSRALRLGQVHNEDPESRLWLVDTIPEHIQATLNNLRDLPNPEAVTGIVASGESAAGQIPDGIGLVIDDASHEPESTVANFNAYAPKLSPHGLMLFHDMAEYSENSADYVTSTTGVLTRAIRDTQGYTIFWPGGSYLGIQKE